MSDPALQAEGLGAGPLAALSAGLAGGLANGVLVTAWRLPPLLATPVGSLIGVLILGVVRNGFTLAGVSTVWPSMLAGLILIAAAILNQRLAEGRRNRLGSGP